MRSIERQILFTVLCLSLFVWSALPSFTHTPDVTETIQDHLEMIADHGHSHGFEEDLAWALHGHDHDVLDHDHSQLLAMSVHEADRISNYQDTWAMKPLPWDSGLHFRIDRPPRA